MASPFADTPELIAEAVAGRMFILVDDESRENEGDLIIPGQFATPVAINFMARYGRGLICLALTRGRVAELNLPAMSAHNQTRHETAFTVSIEAREGVTTGISAADRAHTIQVAIDPTKHSHDLVSPGHVFPLAARDGGVLVRAGHTEAAVDISRLAGLNPSGVICEIMNDDGTMARLPDLIGFARSHGLKIGTIADLISYRRRTEILIELIREHEFVSMHGGEWRLRVYRNTAENSEHLALVKGTIEKGQTALVRMHSYSLFDDLLASEGGRAHLFEAAMQEIGRVGAGILVLIRNFNSLRFTDIFEADRRRGRSKPISSALREYGVGAQILLDLGVEKMVLLTNTNLGSIVGLEAFGLEVVETRAFDPLHID